MDDLTNTRDVLEAALLVAAEPMTVAELQRLFEPPLDAGVVRELLDRLRAEWSSRSVELAQVASGWRFQTKPGVQVHLERVHPERPPRYSRAVMETLAIVAYQQPVTRGDIEAIRGVAVSTNVVKVLEEREWIEVVGHKETPGRPALYATTKKFLDDLGLRSLGELPPLADLDPSHLLELPDASSQAATEAESAHASPVFAPGRSDGETADHAVHSADDARGGAAASEGPGEAAPAGIQPAATADAGPAALAAAGAALAAGAAAARAAGGPALPPAAPTLH
jgi:segregation and condensation protein B